LSTTVISSKALECTVLFDIDGTLVTGSPVKPSAGVLAMNQAALAVTGIDGLYRLVEFAGRTDRQIARDLMAAAKADSPNAARRLVDLYLHHLEINVKPRPYVALCGVRETVAALRDRGAVAGLGTGNVRRGAEVKLRSAGLDGLFDYDLGGYGDDADSRGDVLRVGALRCDVSALRRVVVVGDTPHDVTAAHQIGAVCVAVTTGMYGAEALRAAGADHVASRLEPTLLTAIEGLLCSGR
jgi:phosphoglycolate phosphatase-like HAD superfamily hydrolase